MLIKSNFIDIISYLQLCSAKLPGYSIIIEANSILSSSSIALIIGLLTFLLLVKNGKLNITYLF